MFPPESDVPKWRRLHLALFWSLAFIALFCWGGRSLWESSEARYGEVAREMLETGQWLVPHLNGHPHVTKPPLAYWTTAASMAVLGVNDWGARLPLCFAFVGTVLCVWKLASAMGHSRAEALCAAVVFATGGFSYAASFVLTTDPFLTFWIGLGMLGLWRSWTAPSRASLLMFWGGFGFAFLTKGPPAWLHLAAIPAFLLLRSGRPSLPTLRPLVGLPLMLAIGLSWFLVVVAMDPGRLSYFLRDEIANRVLTNEFKRNGPVYQYFLILGLGPFPWILAWPRAARSIMAGFRAGIRSVPDWMLFCLLWFVLPFAVFCISKSRMPLYVLPLFFPLSLVLGKSVAAAFARAADWSPLRRRATVFGAGLWLLPLLATRVLPDAAVSELKAPRGEADALAHAFDGVEPGSGAFWVFANPLHSIGFYLDRTIVDSGARRTRDLPELQRPFKAEGKRTLFVTELDEVERFERTGRPVDVLARSKQFCVFELIGTQEEAEATYGAPRGANGAAAD